MDELLAWLRDRLEDGEYSTAETFLRDLERKGNDYDNDMSIRDAKIRELTGERDTLAGSVQDLKARNYDLLMQIPAPETVEEPKGDGQVVETVDDGEIIHIDNLFEDPEDEKED